jgi:hypothetical protein
VTSPGEGVAYIAPALRFARSYDAAAPPFPAISFPLLPPKLRHGLTIAASPNAYIVSPTPDTSLHRALDTTLSVYHLTTSRTTNSLTITNFTTIMNAQLRIVSFLALILGFVAALAGASPVARDVYVPPVTYPKAGTVWYRGQVRWTWAMPPTRRSSMCDTCRSIT